jgi:hypothetical protein
MPTKLTTLAPERGTYVVRASFADENEDAVTPNSGLTWTLTDAQGTVVNSRLAVSIVAASTVNIVLTGLDLALGDELFGKTRKLLIEGTYNSSLGNNLPIKEEITFTIANFTKLAGIT